MALQEAILKPKSLSASNYFRGLLIQDLKARNLLTEEILESLAHLGKQPFFSATATA